MSRRSWVEELLNNCGAMLERSKMSVSSVFELYSLNINELSSLDNEDESGKLRLYTHQVNAIRAIMCSFAKNDSSNSSNVATAVLPTGTGKSAIAVILCYALPAKNVLVVSPSYIVSEQLHADFCGVPIYRKISSNSTILQPPPSSLSSRRRKNTNVSPESKTSISSSSSFFIAESLHQPNNNNNEPSHILKAVKKRKTRQYHYANTTTTGTNEGEEPNIQLRYKDHRKLESVDWKQALVLRRGIFDLVDVLPPYPSTLFRTSEEVKAALPFRNTQTLVVTNAHKFGSVSSIDLNQFPSDFFDLIIIDEAHHYPAETWKAIVDHFRIGKILFMTATPNDELCKTICFQYNKIDAIRDGNIITRRWSL
jgi:superfamily II DNA or RNA helicase